MSLLEIDRVCKRFGSLSALRELSLSLGAGQRLALLGHNGAGKTTLFRLILGFIRADAGALSIDGQVPGSKSARAAVSYLPESVAFPRMLSGREIIRFYAKLKKVPRRDAESMLERVGLEGAIDRRVGTYSKGMRQRLGLAQALIGHPALLLLDEPTSGLDPLSRQQFYRLIDEAAANGSSVLLSSHSLSEVAEQSERIAILRQGVLVADGSLAELRELARLPVRIRLDTVPERSDEIALALGGERVNGRAVLLHCTAGQKLALLGRIGRIGADVRDIEISPPSLDALYEHFCGDEGRGDRSVDPATREAVPC